MIGYRFAISFCAATLWLSINCFAEDGWPNQPKTDGPVESFLMVGLPPWGVGRNIQSVGGGYFFKSPESLILYNEGYPISELIAAGKVVIFERDHALIARETITTWHGRVHDEVLGDGYAIFFSF